MEAKETVMSDHEMVAEMEARHWGGNTILHRTPLDEREIQAGISFSAGENQGIQKVVEWIDSNVEMVSYLHKVWQNQKKDWGL